MADKPKSVRAAIGNVLEDLKEEEFRKFKACLHEYPVKPGYDNIPRGKLEKADALAVSDLLVGFYDKEYAPQVTIEVLKSVNCLPQAAKLRWDS